MTMFKTIALFVVFLNISLIVSSVKAGSCGGVLKDKVGEIVTPNYPNNYPNNITCKWEIATETTHVNLTIDDFALEDSSTCDKFDYVKISFKRRWGNEEGIAVCGSITRRQETLHVKGFAVGIIFHSDLSNSNKGFTFHYKSFDIDPCLTNMGGCSHFCNLVRGKRQCSCPSGFRLSYDERTCRYNTSCYFVGHTVCSYASRSYCHDLPDGKHKCVCYSGYRKVNNVCTDIDECEEKPGVCNPGKCKNRQGYHSCTCPAGYTSYGTKCNDRDECKDRQPPNCGNGTCVNTVGSYSCQCEPGYYFNKTLVNCQDRDECAFKNGGCTHKCLNSPGKHSCLCRPGFYLDNDGKTCRELKIEQIGVIRKATICQGQKRQISCDSKALVMYTATYGRTAVGRDVCPYKEGAPPTDTADSSTEALRCGQKNVTDKITEMCGWKKTCDLVANDSLLGSFCPGTYKYLSVIYGCGIAVKCPFYPQDKLCSYPTPDACATDGDCQGSQMCCHNGCETVCLEPTSYYRDD